MTFMMGYAGELIFWLDDAGKPIGLEILKHWSPYTPRMEPGKVYHLPQETPPMGK